MVSLRNKCESGGVNDVFVSHQTQQIAVFVTVSSVRCGIF